MGVYVLIKILYRYRDIGWSLESYEDEIIGLSHRTYNSDST